MQHSFSILAAVAARLRARRWRVAWIALALVYAAPFAWIGYQRVIEVTQRQRTQLIEQHRLWEVDRHYKGSPRTWTRVAAWILSDSQLMSRVAQKYGTLAQQIELDYRRDLMFARAEAVLPLVAWWAIPLGALYGLNRMVRRRPKRPAPKSTPASIFDPRYRPPASADDVSMTPSAHDTAEPK